MTKPDAINWGNLNESDTAYFRTAGAPMSTALANNGYAGADVPDNQDHNTLFRNAYLWEQYLLNRQQANEPTLLYSSGTATWDGSALVLSANLDMSFRIGTGVQINRIAAGTLTFGTDGHVLVLKKDSTTASPVTITSGTYGSLTAGKYAILAGSSLTAADQENELLIFRRNGTNLEIPAIGLVYPTGSVITFGQSSIPAASISGTLPVANGGTNITSYSVGDLLYASGATTLSKLAAPSAGKVLISGGATTAPAWINLSDGAYGLGVTYSAGTFTICKDDGTALSSSNFGVVSVSSTTSGLKILLKVTANVSFNDDAHASSSLTGEEYGSTSGRVWDQDRPFFLYAINSDDTNAGIYFAISQIPSYSSIPSDAQYIGYKGTPATFHLDSCMTTLTASNVSASVINKPCIAIGSFRMQKSTADDWTVSTLSINDGIGNFNENTTFFMPSGQKGAGSGKYTSGNGPSWSTSDLYYMIDRKSNVQIAFSFYDTCTNGSDASTTTFSLPYSAPLFGYKIDVFKYGGSSRIPRGTSVNTGFSYFTAISTIATVVNNGWSSAGDSFQVNGNFKAS